MKVNTVLNQIRLTLGFKGGTNAEYLLMKAEEPLAKDSVLKNFKVSNSNELVSRAFAVGSREVVTILSENNFSELPAGTLASGNLVVLKDRTTHGEKTCEILQYEIQKVTQE
jgi:hypothetical protein